MLNVFQYYNCYPENPKVEDLDLINEWKNKTTLKLSEDFIKTYQGSFLTSLKYALVQSSKRIYLLLIGDKETQPMIYISCIRLLKLLLIYNVHNLIESNWTLFK